MTNLEIRIVALVLLVVSAGVIVILRKLIPDVWRAFRWSIVVWNYRRKEQNRQREEGDEERKNVDVRVRRCDCKSH